MDSRLIEQIAAYSVPNRLPIENDEQREQRNWAIRLVEDLPDEWDAESESARLSEAARSAVAAAQAARGLPVSNVTNQPTVRVMLVDGRHLIARIETIKLENDDAHAYLVAASAALIALNSTTPIEEIQGIPRRFWRIVLGQRE
jgi:hypothetical protein